jgi:hypothetical protein
VVAARNPSGMQMDSLYFYGKRKMKIINLCCYMKGKRRSIEFIEESNLPIQMLCVTFVICS